MSSPSLSRSDFYLLYSLTLSSFPDCHPLPHSVEPSVDYGVHLPSKRRIYVTSRPLSAGSHVVSEEPIVFSRGASASDWHLTEQVFSSSSFLSAVSELPLPGLYAASRQFFSSPFDELEPSVLSELAAIRRHVPEDRVDLEEIFRVFGIVCRNSLTVSTPLSDIPLGRGLYLAVSYFSHACVPNCEAIFDFAGNVHIYSLCDIPADTELTLNRFIICSHFVFTIQSSPPWMRAAFDAKFGSRCTCADCLRFIRTVQTWVGAGNPQTHFLAALNSVWSRRSSTAGMAADVAALLDEYPLMVCSTLDMAEVTGYFSVADFAALVKNQLPLIAGSVHYVTVALLLLKTAIMAGLPMAGSVREDIARRAAAFGEVFQRCLLIEQGASPLLIDAKVAKQREQFLFLFFGALGDPLPVDGTPVGFLKTVIESTVSKEMHAKLEEVLGMPL